MKRLLHVCSLLHLGASAHELLHMHVCTCTCLHTLQAMCNKWLDCDGQVISDGSQPSHHQQVTVILACDPSMVAAWKALGFAAVSKFSERSGKIIRHEWPLCHRVQKMACSLDSLQAHLTRKLENNTSNPV